MPDSKVEDLITEKSASYGKVVYLLGTAEYGPTNQPTRIKSEAHMYSIFGFRGSLIEAYSELKTVSPTAKVYLCKITGRHAVARFHINIAKGGVEENALIVKAIHSHDDFNNINLSWKEDRLIVSSDGEIRFYEEFLYDDYITLNSLIAKINNEAKTGKGLIEMNCSIDANVYLRGSLNSVNAENVSLFGGENGLGKSKNELYEDLKFTYEILEGADCDIVVPVGMFIDDINVEPEHYGTGFYGESTYRSNRDYLNATDEGNPASYYNITTRFCGKQRASGRTTIAVMGYNETSDMYISEDSPDFIKKHLIDALNSNYIEDISSNYKFLTQVVAGDLINTRTTNVTNGYLHYAGMIVNIGCSGSVTNKPLTDRIQLFNELENDQIIELSQNGIACFRHSIAFNRVVACSAVTSSTVDNHYRYLHNVVKILFAVSALKDLSNLYIGQPIKDLMTKRRFENILRDALYIVKKYGVINDFNIKVSQIGRHDIKVDLELKTEYMLEFIRTDFKVRSKGGKDFGI